MTLHGVSAADQHVHGWDARRASHVTGFMAAISGLVCTTFLAQGAKKRPVVGILGQGTPAQRKGVRWIQSFLNGMRDLGYIEGRD
jgi:hypothetical protein